MVNIQIILQPVMNDSKNHIAIWDFTFLEIIFTLFHVFVHASGEKNNVKVGSKNQIIFHKNMIVVSLAIKQR